MNEVIYNQNSSSSIFIENIEDSILIIFKGYENPFKYTAVINSIIKEMFK